MLTVTKEIFSFLSPQINVSHNFSECPEGFASNIYEQQCYMLVEEKLSWYQAEEYCRSKNAYLAELIQPEERDAVWNYVRGNISVQFDARLYFLSIKSIYSYSKFINVTKDNYWRLLIQLANQRPVIA